MAWAQVALHRATEKRCPQLLVIC